LPGVASAVEQSRGTDGWRVWDVALKPGASSGAVLEAATATGFSLRGFESHKPSLHEVFIHLVGRTGEALS
jgi:ABC-2 type transport system ATP-binding protein